MCPSLIRTVLSCSSLVCLCLLVIIVFSLTQYFVHDCALPNLRCSYFICFANSLASLDSSDLFAFLLLSYSLLAACLDFFLMSSLLEFRLPSNPIYTTEKIGKARMKIGKGNFHFRQGKGKMCSLHTSVLPLLV